MFAFDIKVNQPENQAEYIKLFNAEQH